MKFTCLLLIYRSNRNLKLQKWIGCSSIWNIMYAHHSICKVILINTIVNKNDMDDKLIESNFMVLYFFSAFQLSFDECWCWPINVIWLKVHKRCRQFEKLWKKWNDFVLVWREIIGIYLIFSMIYRILEPSSTLNFSSVAI